MDGGECSTCESSTCGHQREKKKGLEVKAEKNEEQKDVGGFDKHRSLFSHQIHEIFMIQVYMAQRS